jgi:hypothetical protein
MGKGKTLILGLLCGCFMVGCSNTTKEKQLAATILQDSTLNKVDSMARSVIRQGLNAGSGYSQIWARDMNTFIETACEETDRKDMKIEIGCIEKAAHTTQKKKYKYNQTTFHCLLLS